MIKLLIGKNKVLLEEEVELCQNISVWVSINLLWINCLLNCRIIEDGVMLKNCCGACNINDSMYELY